VPVIDDIAGDSDSGAGQYDVAKNGTLVYRRGSGPARRWQILWVDGSGNTETLVQEPGAYYCIRLSPDGKRLAMTVDLGDKGREIEVFDIQRGSLSRLTFAGEVNLFPVWSPDGKYLVFEASAPNGYGIGLVRADGSGNLQRLAENNNLMIPHSFSPDGQLVYGANGFVWAASFDTSDPNHVRLGAPQQLFAAGGSPMVSPNGRWIAYSSVESGRYEVYVRPFQGPGAKLQISTGGYVVGGIVWAPDSRALYYIGLDNRLMVARFTVEGDTLIAGRPEVWSKAPIGSISDFPRQFSLSADGKRFAVFPVRKAPVEGSVHVTFALNFMEELRRRVK